MSHKNKGKNGLVFSTNRDLMQEPEATDRVDTPEPSKQQLKVYRDKKQRGGKEVTVIEGFQGDPDDLEALGKAIKTHCGTGGTVKEGLILIQGDQRQKVTAYLEKKGYRYKLAGG